jgi:diguanylate cyclase (GGDEF)-like protein
MNTETNVKKNTGIISVIDFFLNATLCRHPDLHSRTRFLVIALLLELFIHALMLTLATIVRYQNAPLVLALCFFGFAIEFGLLYRLKRHGNYAFCGALVVTQAWIYIVGATMITGGPHVSPSIQLLSIPCLMAFFLGGNYWGIAAAFLSIVAVGFMASVQSMGYHFPQIAAPTDFPFVQSFLLPINFVAMTTLSLVYEITYLSVKRQRDQEHERYRQFAATDPLTGLANRRMFDETLAARIKLYNSLNPVRKFALCYLDLDRFKPINDQFGHGVGDEVLNVISRRLQLALRGADFIGRHGGDEFLMLLDCVHDAVTAEAMSQRFLQLVQEPINTSAGLMRVGGSFGIALFPEHGNDAATLQKAADYAMYKAKHEGRGYQIFAQEIKG